MITEFHDVTAVVNDGANHSILSYNIFRIKNHNRLHRYGSLVCRSIHNVLQFPREHSGLHQLKTHHGKTQ